MRTQLVVVPDTRRRQYAERLLERFVAPGGRLIVRSYGSSGPDGVRAPLRVAEMRAWGLPIDRLDDVVSPEHGFVITRVVSVARAGAAQQANGRCVRCIGEAWQNWREVT